jgi:hypothetical protein
LCMATPQAFFSERDSDDPNIQRVAERVSAAVLEFCHPGRQFHMAELNDYCGERVGNLAPDSPGRILRLLRQDGKIKYHVADRRRSKYIVEEKSTAAPTAPEPAATLFGDLDLSPDRTYLE